MADCSIGRALQLNRRPTYSSTYYFSYVTTQSRRSPVSQHCWPSPRMHWLMMWVSAVVGAWRWTRGPRGGPTVPYKGYRDCDW